MSMNLKVVTFLQPHHSAVYPKSVMGPPVNHRWNTSVKQEENEEGKQLISPAPDDDNHIYIGDQKKSNWLFNSLFGGDLTN